MSLESSSSMLCLGLVPGLREPKHGTSTSSDIHHRTPPELWPGTTAYGYLVSGRPSCRVSPSVTEHGPQMQAEQEPEL